MPMTGVRCTACAAHGHEVWVIPGRSCSYCGISCDGSIYTVPKVTKNNRADKWEYHGDLIFTRQPDKTTSATTTRQPCLLDQIWDVSLEHPRALNVIELEAIPLPLPWGSTKLLIRINSSSPKCWTTEEVSRLKQAWKLPMEWLETTSGGQALQVSYCRLKKYNQNPFLNLLLRDIQDSVISTIVLYCDIQTQSVRGFWSTYLPPKFSKAKSQEIEDEVVLIRQRLQHADEHMRHPLVLPVFFLQTRLEQLEQSCANGLSPATYKALSQLADNVNHPRQRSFSETQQDIQSTTEGIYSGHQQLSARRTRIANLKTMLRVIFEASDHLRASKSTEFPEEESSECIKDRLVFIKERLRAVESQIETSRSEFQDLDTMLHNAINQQDSRLNYSIARDSKQIAAASLRDSSAMKTISVLTIVFLPGTFIAALFSTGLFKFTDPSPERLVSKDFWLYWAVTVPVTGAVLLIWLFWLWQIRSQLEDDSHVNHNLPETTELGMPVSKRRRCPF